MIPPFILRTTAQVSNLKTSGAYGNMYDDPIYVKCRLEKQLKKNGRMEDNDRNNYIMFCNPGYDIQEGALVVVDDKSYRVEDIQEVPGLLSIDHLEVMLSGYCI